MIQRIQSFYILILFFLSILIYSNAFNFTPTSEFFGRFISFNGFLGVPLLLLFTLFLYKKRKLQILLCWLLLLMHFGQFGLLLSEVNQNYGLNFETLAILESLVGIFLLWLTKRNIQKDEALVRSVDRIR
jgi:hypothetical protein